MCGCECAFVHVLVIEEIKYIMYFQFTNYRILGIYKFMKSLSDKYKKKLFVSPHKVEHVKGIPFRHGAS